MLDKLYLIKIDDNGSKSEVPASEANFLVGGCGTVNFGFNSQIFSVPQLGQDPTYSLIAGGSYNSTSGAWGVIAGGLYNANFGYLGGVIGGGIFNQVRGNYGAIAGGCFNCIGFLLNDDNSIFAGDSTLIVSNSFIGGGGNNKILGISGDYNSTQWNSIVGGRCNNIRGAPRSFIGGGECNTIFGRGFNVNNYNAILEGCCNRVSSGSYSFILNGERNTITGSYSSILAGRGHNISGSHVAILNGTGNKVFSNNASILAGLRATIPLNHSGAVLLTDSQDRNHTSSGPNTLTLDFASGVYISGSLFVNGRQLLVSTQGTVFSPTTI